MRREGQLEGGAGILKLDGNGRKFRYLDTALLIPVPGSVYMVYLIKESEDMAGETWAVRR